MYAPPCPCLRLFLGYCGSWHAGRYQPTNAYVRAALAEARHRGTLDSDDESGYSDLEDFIVCKPGRDYQNLIAKEFKYSTN